MRRWLKASLFVCLCLATAQVSRELAIGQYTSLDGYTCDFFGCTGGPYGGWADSNRNLAVSCWLSGGTSSDKMCLQSQNIQCLQDRQTQKRSTCGGQYLDLNTNTWLGCTVYWYVCIGTATPAPGGG